MNMPLAPDKHAQHAIAFIATAWRSLRVRLTLATLFICIFGIWGVVTFVTTALQKDLQRALSTQQLAVVSAIASGVDRDMRERIRTLEALAQSSSTSMLSGPAAIQADLLQRPAYQVLFNRGLFVLSKDGTVVADHPSAPGRVGQNFMGDPDVARTLQSGQATVGRPNIGRVLRVPVFSILVPIFGKDGGLLGAIGGLTDLSQSNFLDHFTESEYGKTGGFLLLDAQQRLIIAATDKSRTMTTLPTPGQNPALDALLARGEGTEKGLRQDGVEVIASVKPIAASGWLVAVTLPTQEGFALVHQLKHGLIGIASVITALVSILMWFVLKRQLAPLAVAAADLRQRAGTQARFFPLAVARPDEIGDLIQGFNHLLTELQHREYEQKDIATALVIAAELQERTGQIAHVGGWQLDLETMKLVWTRETFRISEILGEVAPSLAEAVDLFAPEARDQVNRAVQAAIDSGTPFDLELPIIGAQGTRKWVRVQGFAVMSRGKPERLHGTVQDTTERKEVEQLLTNALAEKTALLNEVHHRVKNNLQVITSLLRLESTRSGLPQTKEVLDAMQGRIRSMALLHESLYRSGIFASTDLGAYLRTLSQQSFRSQVDNTGAVRLVLDLASLQVSMDMATPFGLLVNELISNCLKHAFPDGRSGAVCVGMHCLEGDHWSLTVSDNGIGLPNNFQSQNGKSLGLQLVGDLVMQIGGELTVTNAMGSKFEIIFNVKSQVAA